MEFNSGLKILQGMIEKYKIPSSRSKVDLPPRDTVIISRPNITNIDRGTIEIDINEIGLWENPKSGFFEINGIYGVVYRHTSYSTEYDVDSLPKWHATMCQTLKKMMNEGNLYDKYALKQTTILDNEFTLTKAMSSNNQKMRRKLRACINCLKFINQSVGGKYRNAYKYSFTDFAEEFKGQQSFNPNHNNFSINYTPDIYNPDFKNKANQYKKDKPFCEDCGEKFLLRFLEVHHINRKKNDDRISNWKVLCVSCHVFEHRADNPRMRILYEATNRLNEFYQMYPRKIKSQLR